MTLRSRLASWACLALFLGCGARTTENNVGNGSNTNWLRGCDTSETCGDGICASGACTPTCTENSECAELGSRARCGSSVPVVVSSTASCAGAQEVQVCAPSCNDDTECETIGDGYTCFDKTCVPATCLPPSETPTSYVPCAGKSCGDNCLLCAPNDSSCAETEEPRYCDADGQCVGSEVQCPAPTCQDVAAGQCRSSGCTPIVGNVVRACEVQAAEVLGCTGSDASDQGVLSCAIHPETDECYVFPTTTLPAGWNVVDCETSNCSLDTCIDSCFSPTQNLELADVDSDAGCDCAQSGGACIDGIALMCEDGKWRSVFDGPCYPLETPCGGYVSRVYDCLARFQSCSESDLGYCGRGSISSVCEDGIIVPNEGFCPDRAQSCEQLDDGAWCASPLSSLCPENYDVVESCDTSPASYACVRDANAFECQLQTVSAVRCTGVGGYVLSDPGDGSVLEAGCPDGETIYGFVSESTASQLCCLPDEEQQ